MHVTVCHSVYRTLHLPIRRLRTIPTKRILYVLSVLDYVVRFLRSYKSSIRHHRAQQFTQISAPNNISSSFPGYSVPFLIQFRYYSTPINAQRKARSWAVATRIDNFA